MRTLQRATAAVIYPAILCLGVACERASAPTTSPPTRGPQADLTGQTTDWIQRALLFADLVPDATTALVQPEDPPDDPITVVPFEFDPFHSSLVRAFWLRGTGCPTNATVNNGSMSSSFSDPACDALAGGGDPKDSPGKNKGLLLVKTGPTTNFAAAGASLNGVKGITLTELGFDIRTGSHCGAGAPRFNVVTTDGVRHFVGCSSPPPTVTAASPAWQRLRLGFVPLVCSGVSGFNASTGILECITGVVQSITIIFDEGTDTPFESGLAVLDNIDVNGTLVGRGPGN